MPAMCCSTAPQRYRHCMGPVCADTRASVATRAVELGWRHMALRRAYSRSWKTWSRCGGEGLGEGGREELGEGRCGAEKPGEGRGRVCRAQGLRNQNGPGLRDEDLGGQAVAFRVCRSRVGWRVGCRVDSGGNPFGKSREMGPG